MEVISCGKVCVWSFNKCTFLLLQLSYAIYLTRYLYKDDLIPKNTKIIGYARSDLTVDKLRAKIEPFMKVSSFPLAKSRKLTSGGVF